MGSMVVPSKIAVVGFVIGPIFLILDYPTLSLDWPVVWERRSGMVHFGYQMKWM
jgi:hypothetical protein